MKYIYEQLKKNPQVAMCFHHSSKEVGPIMIRVTGTIEFPDATDLTGKLVEEPQFLKA